MTGDAVFWGSFGANPSPMATERIQRPGSGPPWWSGMPSVNPTIHLRHGSGTDAQFGDNGVNVSFGDASVRRLRTFETASSTDVVWHGF
jgi:hypothetical protein